MEDKRGCIAYFSTFPPRKCGLATFTQDLARATDAVPRSPFTSKIVALNTNGNVYDYPDEVLYQIDDKSIEDYITVAQKINNNEQIKLVSVQHEFKIFGSDHSENLLFFLAAIKKPVITTFHTVLPAPSERRKKIIQSIAQHSEYIVVMTQSAINILKEDYDLEPAKLVIIPHGIHDLPYEKNTPIKEKLGYGDKILLTSFGLLRSGRARNSSGKGCEYVLDALPEIIKKFPNILYLIIGATHPKYLKVEGERYREFLQQKVEELGIENNVKFINKYLPLKELLQYLQASDIYVSSSLNENQISSGTLVYAMGCGRAVVSTSFLHAKDIVSPERGILAEFKNSQSFADAAIKILSNPRLKEAMELNAYAYTRQMIWSNVALSYLDLFNTLETPEICVEVLPEIAVSNGFYSGFIPFQRELPVQALHAHDKINPITLPIKNEHHKSHYPCWANRKI